MKLNYKIMVYWLFSQLYGRLNRYGLFLRYTQYAYRETDFLSDRRSESVAVYIKVTYSNNISFTFEKFT